MQKFKVTREEIRKWYNTLPSKDLGWIIPETAILEGELLEGGTGKEEVQLPEMLRENNVVDFAAYEKINEILTYLASKEKKGDK